MNLEFRCKEMRMLPNKDFNSVWNRLTERELPIFMIGICWCGRIARSCAFSIEVCPCRLFLWISIQNLFDSNRILLWTKPNLQLTIFILFYQSSIVSKYLCRYFIYSDVKFSYLNLEWIFYENITYKYLQSFRNVDKWKVNFG